MKVTDLTGEYIEKLLKDEDFSAYKGTHPEIFEHYFAYWADENTFEPTLNKEDTLNQKDLILSRLGYIEEQMNKNGFDTDSLEIILFVGSNCANGHSFKYKDKFVTWIAIESYDSIEKVDMFLTHELIHSLHYSKNPEFYFSNKLEKESLERQLITEGLATYITVNVMEVSEGKALWADFLDTSALNKWFEMSKKELKELSKDVCKSLSSQEQVLSGELFLANDNKDVRKFRIGYYLGLKIVEDFNTKKLTPSQLLSTSKSEWQNFIKNYCISK